MKEAVLAIEDARFYRARRRRLPRHGARRAGATSRKARSQGASTITMQVARNFYLSHRKDLHPQDLRDPAGTEDRAPAEQGPDPRALHEPDLPGAAGLRLCGGGEIYFGKPLKDLTVAEAAMLAGLPKAPSAYNPIANPKRATIRQQYIIDRMLDNGFITEEQRDRRPRRGAALRTPPTTVVHAEYVAESRAPAGASPSTARDLHARPERAPDGQRQPTRWWPTTPCAAACWTTSAASSTAGPRPTSTCRPTRTSHSTPASPRRWPSTRTTTNCGRRGAGSLAAKVVAVLQSGETVTVTGDGLRPVASGLADKAEPQEGADPARRRGARWCRARRATGRVTQLPEVEGAFVALDPRTGAIRALVGGFDFRQEQVQPRHAGLAPAGLELQALHLLGGAGEGLHARPRWSTMRRCSSTPASTGSQPWEPKNYDGKFDGPMPLRHRAGEVEEHGLDPHPAVDRPEYAQDWITRFGFERRQAPGLPDDGPGRRLGHTAADGQRLQRVRQWRLPREPYLISKVADSEGASMCCARRRRCARRIDARASTRATPS
jgi:penicillin-binding protein 1A